MPNYIRIIYSWAKVDYSQVDLGLSFVETLESKLQELFEMDASYRKGSESVPSRQTT